jgi:hypothetical protein
MQNCLIAVKRIHYWLSFQFNSYGQYPCYSIWFDVLVFSYTINPVIKFVSDMQKVGGFLRFALPIKLSTTI